VLLCAATGVRYANAADADSVRLLWLRGTNAEHCPEQVDLERRVRNRLGRDPFTPTAVRTIEASLYRSFGVWHAELNVSNATGQVEGRRRFDVRAESCAQVVDAIGLAVALAIDPQASSSAETTPQPIQQPSFDAGHAGAASRPSTGASDWVPAVPNRAMPWAPRPARDSHCPPTDAISPKKRRPLSLDNRPNYAYEMSLLGLSAAGLLPGVAPGIAVEGAFGGSGPRLVLGLAYFPETALNSQFSFGLTTVNAGLCGDIVKSTRVSGSLCGDVEAGAMHAVVRQLVPLHPGDRMFLALGLGPRLGWHAWAPLFFQGGVAARIGLVRPEFAVKGEASQVFESRAVSGVAFVGVGISIR
jgi:hypothetical protein